MKYSCNLIKDLMPLYHDKACSEESTQAVEEHFTECSDCKAYYNSMCESDVVEVYAYEKEQELQTAESYKKVKKKMKKTMKIRTIIIIVLVVIIAFLVKYGAPIALMGLLALSENAQIEVYEDVADYNRYIGEKAEEDFVNKWDMDESIFPETITANMQVDDYVMVYYNPWDAQYLSFLEVTYSDSDYDKEVERLNHYESTKYKGYYGVTGFEEDYTLLAMYADSYQGFVYALTDNVDTIIYVEIIFCNYMMDLDYTKYIPQQFLPTGFDATSDNPYAEEKLKEMREESLRLF